jgi:hypothetical protein
MRHFFAASQAVAPMPLSSPTSRRALTHTRAIQIDAFARDDGLWDLDARISDTKTHDEVLTSGIRPAGAALHDLWLRLTVDRQLNVVDAEAVSDAVPYPGFCDTIGVAYKSLVGLNLLQGFRKDLKQRLSGTNGCTHLTELAQVLPTVAIQAFGGDIIDTGVTSSAVPHSQKPFELDRCHALRSDGAAVAQYYPRWAVKSLAVSESS